jgi:FAD:protein FMN transferase
MILEDKKSKALGTGLFYWIKIMHFLLVVSLVFLVSCGNKDFEKVYFSGNAQGTTYNIVYFSPEGKNLKHEVDSLLLSFDYSLSTYNPASLISKINSNTREVVLDTFFVTVLNRSLEIAKKTNGLFDVTIAPIVNAWGFGFTKKAEVTPELIDSLRQFTGFEKVWLEDNQLVKTDKRLMLDFNAIAQGYSVDVVGKYLQNQGIDNFMVEIGGEVFASGNKPEGKPWKVGIDTPKENLDERELKAIIELNNRGLATSGNYRKYYEENGVKYSHTIDPRTGYPAMHNLLSATVIAKDCMTADAYATAFMVMGLEKSKEFINDNIEPDLEALFIYSDEKGELKTYFTEGLVPLLSLRD